MTIIKQIKYRGFLITVKEYPSRFGTKFTATSNYGEPYLQIPFHTEMADAIEWEKKNLDQCIDQ